MPRKTKEINEENESKKVTKKASSTKAKKAVAKADTVKEPKKVAKKATSTKTKKAVAKADVVEEPKKDTKKATSTKTKKAVAKADAVKEPKKVTKKASAKTDAVKEPKKATKKATSTKTKKASAKTDVVKEPKKATKKAATTKTKKTTTKKATSTKAKKVTSKKRIIKKATTRGKKIESNISEMEYYDLPYGYNQTVIKLLAQTPNKIFVYLELSQDDVNNFMSRFGNNFFYDTYPVLTVYNKSKGYYFDVRINDFANCWYIDVPDDDCKYMVTLKRVFKDPSPSLPSQTVEITTSNELVIPNGHVITTSGRHRLEFINWKTNYRYFKDLVYINNNSINFEKVDFNNPSSNFNQF